MQVLMAVSVAFVGIQFLIRFYLKQPQCLKIEDTLFTGLVDIKFEQIYYISP